MSDITKRLKDLTTEIDGYTQSVLTGEAVDIEGMDERVASVCDEIESMEQKQATQYSEDLQTMISALDHLVTAIKNNPEIFEDEE